MTGKDRVERRLAAIFAAHDLIEYAAKRLPPESLEDLTWNTFE